MEKFLLYLGYGSSLFYLIQIIITFAGGDHFEDSDSSDSGGEMGTLRVFTLKNLMAFLVGFSWITLSANREWGWEMPLSVIAGSLSGALLVIVQMLIFYLVSKLEVKDTGTLDAVLFSVAKVYLSIPPAGEGEGKVIVVYRGSERTMAARTKTGIKIPTGSSVRIDAIEGGVLIVSPL